MSQEEADRTRAEADKMEAAQAAGNSKGAPAAGGSKSGKGGSKGASCSHTHGDGDGDGASCSHAHPALHSAGAEAYPGEDPAAALRRLMAEPVLDIEIVRGAAPAPASDSALAWARELSQQNADPPPEPDVVNSDDEDGNVGEAGTDADILAARQRDESASLCCAAIAVL